MSGTQGICGWIESIFCVIIFIMQTHFALKKKVRKNVTRAYTKRIICQRLKCKLKRIPFHIWTPSKVNSVLFHRSLLIWLPAFWWADGNGLLQLTRKKSVWVCNISYLHFQTNLTFNLTSNMEITFLDGVFVEVYLIIINKYKLEINYMYRLKYYK